MSKPTRNCHYQWCQRHDENAVRIEVNDPTTGELVSVVLRFCPAHAPEVWDLIGIRQSIVESLEA